MQRVPLASEFTVAQCVKYWLEHRRGEVRGNTWKSYVQGCAYVIGPLLVGTKSERFQYARWGHLKVDAQFLEMLGPVTINELTTAQIRTWHKTLGTHVSGHTANVAKKFLRAALCLAAEDFMIPIPPMPSRIGRGHTRAKKTILAPEQVGLLLQAALRDERGIYYAFPFLTGVRPSEQLALLWEDVSLEEGSIRIRRTQLPDGFTTELTKTDASLREIPISPLLSTMLINWRAKCPVLVEHRQRVFPLLGRRGHKQHKKIGCPLGYTNFIYNYWRPALSVLHLPLVTPHSARHSFISILQANGVEVGLVAKLAGHADPAVTLSHYTQAVRGGKRAIQTLERAYGYHPETTSGTLPNA